MKPWATVWRFLVIPRLAILVQCRLVTGRQGNSIYRASSSIASFTKKK